jgi:hypothetical protein
VSADPSWLAAADDLAALSVTLRADLAAREGATLVIAIDGGAASGKSSLAAELDRRLRQRRAGRTEIVHVDDLLDGWAGQFSFADRLRADVLAPAAGGRAGRYRRYDWLAGRFGDEVRVEPADFLIVEGVSAVDACTGYLGLGIFVDVPRAERERRWSARDRPGARASDRLPDEWARWLDREDRFFAQWQPPDNVPFVVIADPAEAGPSGQDNSTSTSKGR